MLRYFTAGETHGPCLTAIVEGMPAGVPVSIDKINQALARRQKGHGRGGRMKIEKDTAEILSGVRGGYTLGSPVTIKIENKDWKNWQEIMGAEHASGQKAVTCPRPGHADLAGGMKYGHQDLRNVLERASARETAARVAVGALVRQVLEQFDVRFFSHVVQIGDVMDTPAVMDEDFFQRAAASPVGFAAKEAEDRAVQYIDGVKARGESCGGVVEVVVTGLPAGLGSYVHYDRKIDANLAMAVMSVQAIKGVEFGMGFAVSANLGSSVHDEIVYDRGFHRKSNHAGGIEGGMTNGEPVVVRAAMKPIPTLYNPLETVELSDKTSRKASVERSDTCAVPACAVVVEAAVAFEITKFFLDKFNGDCLTDVRAYYESYMRRIAEY